MKSFMLALIVCLTMAHSAFAEGDDVKITEIVITSRIVKGKPVDSIKRLSSSTDKRLYCFTRTLAPEGFDAKLRHVWYNGGEKVGEFDLPIRGGKWRTYSKKLIQRGAAGDWRVEVLDSGGRLLKTVKFRMN